MTRAREREGAAISGFILHRVLLAEGGHKAVKGLATSLALWGFTRCSAGGCASLVPPGKVNRQLHTLPFLQFTNWPRAVATVDASNTTKQQGPRGDVRGKAQRGCLVVLYSSPG